MDFCLAFCPLNPALIAYSVGPRFPQLRRLHLGHRESQPLPFVVAAAHGCLALIPFKQSSCIDYSCCPIARPNNVFIMDGQLRVKSLWFPYRDSRHRARNPVGLY